MSRAVGIIPARYLSTRFPGKPLVDIAGKSMICRVYDQCIKTRELEKVYVATDDDRIFKEVTGKGGLAVMTDSMAINGTMRCLDAYEKIRAIEGDFDFLVNIQGDEPFIQPEQITELVHLISTCEAPVATLVKEINDPNDLWDDNVVKVILDEAGNAIYFSRQAIPYQHGIEKHLWLNKWTYIKHIGIYAFKTTALDQIKSLHPTSLEKTESLEQLRWLGRGIKMAVALTNYQTIAIDTPSDLEKAIKFVQSNI